MVIPEVMVKFPTQEVIDTLTKGEQELTIRGRVKAQTPFGIRWVLFEGSDVVKVIG